MAPPRRRPDVPKVDKSGLTNPLDTLNLLPDRLKHFVRLPNDGIVR